VRIKFAAMAANVLYRYGLDKDNCLISPFGNGLINHSWKVTCGKKEFLLQQINQQVFRNPPQIMQNLAGLEAYFKLHHPDYLFVAPIPGGTGQNYVKDEAGNYYRLFPFIKNSFSCDMVSDPALAYEAARQFGKFTRLLTPFNPGRLAITLPDFHNLSLRYRQFETALQNGNKKRISDSGESIAFLKDQKEIANEYEEIKNNETLKVRVIHHDAKINNVLFDKVNQTGLCLVDLDTVMPGYYISDVGDMLRTYICPVDEEEPDINRIMIREEYFLAIVNGYLGEMNTVLTENEKKYFVYAGKFAIYMQALRFLTDYINDDIYYSIKYENQNRVRARNQVTLLMRFMEKEDQLNNILKIFLQNSMN
jgi:Phosphotransferase enzyme family